MLHGRKSFAYFIVSHMKSELSQRKNLLVYRSSAGSGKTFTLVLNYLSILLSSQNKLKFREILAITFTNKAANEMKSRVFSHLIDLSKGPDKSKLMDTYSTELNMTAEEIASAANERLSVMLHNYTDIAIMTIDKFSHRLIRSFARDLNLEADFEIELDLTKVIQESIDLLIDQVGTREDLTELLVHHAKDKAKSDKSWKAITELNEFGKLIAKEDTRKWIQEVNEWSVSDLFKIHKQASSLAQQLIQANRHLGSTELQKINHNQWSAYIAKNGWDSFFKDAIAGDYTRPLMNPRASIKKGIDEDKWFKKNTPTNVLHSFDQQKKETKTAYHQILANCNVIIRQQIIRDQIIGIGLLKEITALIEEYKKRNNLVLISDFNKTISDIVLEEPTPFIYERIGTKFKHYFIDEFQDTSVQQWQNFIPLVDDTLAQGYQNLLVGDAKQAIYRFRNGEAKQFVLLPDIYEKQNSPILMDAENTFKAEINCKKLDSNWRSSRTIVEFNNQLFRHILSSITEPSIHRNYDGFEQIPQNKSEGFVAIRLDQIPRNKAEDRKQFRNNATLEAIKECLEDGYHLSDITVLVRQNAHGQEIADFLLENGLDVTSSDSLTLLRNKDVLTVISFMKLLDNTQNQEDTLRISNYLFPEEQTEAALKLALRTTRDHGKQKLLELILITFNINILEWQSLPLYLKARNIVSAFFGHEAQDQFLESLLENVHNFSVKKGEDISLFFDWLNEKNPSIEGAESENAIRIMSIHKSKGLEFKIVVIHKCDWNLKPSNNSRVWTRISSEKQALNVHLMPSEKKFEVLGKENEFNEAFYTEYLDGLNMFYVAVTRPVDRLYMSSPSCETNTVADLLKQYIEHIGSTDWPCLYTCGKRQKTDNVHQCFDDRSALTFTYESSSNLIVDIATKKSYENYENSSEQKWGQLIHTALEKVRSNEEVDVLANQYLLLGKITAEEKAQFIQSIRGTLNHEQLSNWLNSDWQELREKEIIDEAGEVYRPDRIILAGDETILLDFKTGQPRAADESQITNYSYLLRDLGYLKIRKYLFYVEEFRLKEVLTL